MPLSIKNLPKEEILLQPGHAACPGCPIGIGLRIVGKVLGKRTVIVVPACCTSIIQGPYPYSAIKVPLVNVIFAASAAVASGIASAFEAMGVRDVNVVVWAGDGGTADIGLQALSGAAERNDNIIYICYDNEAYMNTGIQRSSSTPYKAWTTTTVTGKQEFKKNVPAIVAQHRIPYVATASIGYPLDFAEKLQKASKIKGFKYIHLLAPCPVGWRFDPSLTIEVGKLAVLTGLWPLYEVENGVFRLTSISLGLLDKSRRVPVEKYLRLQGRFKHITDEDIKVYEEYVDQLWEVLRKLHGKKIV
ncbi:MAG TPA: pyruvate synthase subunit beta [Desulfurococcales archaeon]|nr:pyruvate synthase subunit beta [Desulfurococcales archaeon]